MGAQAKEVPPGCLGRILLRCTLVAVAEDTMLDRQHLGIKVASAEVEEAEMAHLTDIQTRQPVLQTPAEAAAEAAATALRQR